MKPNTLCASAVARLFARSRLAPASALLLAATMTACGSSPPPASAQPAPKPEPVSATPEPAASGAPGSDSAAVEACLAAAGAKRARFSGEPEKVGLRHVLVRYKGSKSANESVTRSREEACIRAAEARDKVREGADFEEIVKQYSDEPGAASRGGSVGTVERTDLVKPFADAAFELSVNQLSDVVETEYGFHIILRTE